MPKCLFTRCFYCINLRVGCAIVGTILLLIKMTECFFSTIAAIDLFDKALKDKTRHNMETGGERLGAFSIAGFHWITMMIVCVLLEGLRRREPLRVYGFNVCTMIAYAVYIPVFIVLVAKNGSGYTHQDWVATGLRIGIISWYVYTILLARSYHHELTNKRSNTDRNNPNIF